MQAFNRPLDTVFSSVSEKPVAAASLGQVYRCTLQPELGGGDVAVKVQRPGVLEAVSLDLYLMRNVALIMQKTLKVGVCECTECCQWFGGLTMQQTLKVGVNKHVVFLCVWL